MRIGNRSLIVSHISPPRSVLFHLRKATATTIGMAIMRYQ